MAEDILVPLSRRNPQHVSQSMSTSRRRGNAVQPGEPLEEDEAFEAKVEDQLKRIRLRMFENKNKAIGGKGTDVLNEFDKLQRSQHEILERHLGLEAMATVGGRTTWDSTVFAQEISGEMRRREEDGLKIVEQLETLDVSIRALSAQIEESRRSDEVQEWEWDPAIDITHEDDSEEFNTCEAIDS